MWLSRSPFLTQAHCRATLFYEWEKRGLDSVNTHWFMRSSPPTFEWEQLPAQEFHRPAQLRKKLSITQSISYFSVLLFSIIYFARPEDWIPGARDIPVAKIVGFVALGTFLLNLLVRGKLNLSRGVLLLLVFFGQLCLAIPFSTWRGGSFDLVYEFSKIVLIVLLLVQAVDTFPRLRQLIFVQTAAVITISVVSLVNKTQIAGRITGSVGGIFGNPNDLAAVISIVMPFCFAFLQVTR